MAKPTIESNEDFMVELWLDAVGKGQTVGAASCIGQPIVGDVIEQIGLSVDWVEKIAGTETQSDVVAKSFGQAEI